MRICLVTVIVHRGYFVSSVCFVDCHVTFTGPAREYLESLQLLQHLQVLRVLSIKSNKKPSKLWQDLLTDGPLCLNRLLAYLTRNFSIRWLLVLNIIVFWWCWKHTVQFSTFRPPLVRGLNLALLQEGRNVQGITSFGLIKWVQYIYMQRSEKSTHCGK